MPSSYKPVLEQAEAVGHAVNCLSLMVSLADVGYLTGIRGYFSIDVLERGMYNNALSGVAVSGARFFYVNRLASAGDGRDTRWERASLECCPPNLVRFLAAMPGFIYAQDRRPLYRVWQRHSYWWCVFGEPVGLRCYVSVRAHQSDTLNHCIPHALLPILFLFALLLPLL
jgi:DUF1680 family protein